MRKQDVAEEAGLNPEVNVYEICEIVDAREEINVTQTYRVAGGYG